MGGLSHGRAQVHPELAPCGLNINFVLFVGPFRTGAVKAKGQTDTPKIDFEVAQGERWPSKHPGNMFAYNMWVLGVGVCRWRRLDTYSWHSHVLKPGSVARGMVLPSLVQTNLASMGHASW